MSPTIPTRWTAPLLTVIAVGAMLIMFDDSFVRMVGKEWQEPEYQHGFLMPFVSLYLVWACATNLSGVPRAPSWIGVGVICAGLVMFLVGQLSSIWFIVWYAFLFTFWGMVISLIGLRGTSVIWAGLFYMVFMIPLPAMWQFALSGTFQLWSSEIGVAILRAIGISVYLEGNVIDLGAYKLQVVEACSGLRYLFPLASLAFFCAYIFRGRLWQKALIFLSAVPITILMNSLRIGITGLLVNRYGTGQAEGFLHYFEGWVIFVACIASLFLVMAIFSRLNKSNLATTFKVEIPALSDFRYLVPDVALKGPVAAALGLVVAGALASLVMNARTEKVPSHPSLKTFPTVISQWSGLDSELEGRVLNFLNLTEYVLINYQRPTEAIPVELYVAYYESQRTGASIHSPRACLPGGGWQIKELKQIDIDGVRPDDAPLPVNRVVIAQGGNQALVYYWFMQRGRYLTDEYLLKWYIVWDALTEYRTDGALVRVTTPILSATDVEAADRRLTDFIKAAEPKLYYYIPQGPVAAGHGVPEAAFAGPPLQMAPAAASWSPGPR